ncbi:MAG: DUF6298 domain-containing protein [Planctomycetota bacterium]|jgi:hypothetical protein
MRVIVIYFVMLYSILGISRYVVADTPASKGLHLDNGWFVNNGRVVWGYAQHNGWWRPGQRPNLTRRAPKDMGPNRTEDLKKLTDNMLRYAYPGFEHNFGLWYDRRRDAHDTQRRNDAKVIPPFLEQPWARSSHGKAWDGLTKYDLTRFNTWYFKRLKTFASLCDRKGTILFHNFYMQHALLETNAHYVDFPWRPTNCIQKTEMPDTTPAANVFYDIKHPIRCQLHRTYIRKCLDELGHYTNIVHLVSEEYTGPVSFMKFWIDTISEWEREKGKNVIIAVGATKDVLNVLAHDHRVSVLDLRYWWYLPNGSPFAPKGGREVSGRYVSGHNSAKTTPAQIYRQVMDYRQRYPNKGIIHAIEASRQQTWAFLMAGGSMLIRRLEEPRGKNLERYVAPTDTRIIQPTYNFINNNLSEQLKKMVPQNLVLNNRKNNWCLAESNQAYLVYALRGGQVRIDLSRVSGTFVAKWFDPRTGALLDASGGVVKGGGIIDFIAPDSNDWALWLSRMS